VGVDTQGYQSGERTEGIAIDQQAPIAIQFQPIGSDKKCAERPALKSGLDKIEYAENKDRNL